MELLINIAVALEMIFVNLTTSYLCLKKKASNLKIISVLTIFTVVVVSMSLLFITRMKIYGNGNGLFAIIGFIYLLPLKYLYDEPLNRIMVVVCSSWIYTMFVFSLSVHIARLFDMYSFSLTAFTVQTTIYALTVYPFLKFVKEKFIYVLKNIPDRTNKYLQNASLTWFATAVVVNLAFVQYDNSYLKLIAILFLAANALTSYLLIHTVVKGSKNIELLQKIAYTDNLTQLRNRTSLFREADDLVKSEIPFSLIYMDLNSFKSINDNYGHLTGDEYLKRFAKEASSVLGASGALYRMSGDEFICLYTGDDVEKLLNELVVRNWKSFQDIKVDFLGVSLGHVSFPEDGLALDYLIKEADKRMYEHKNSQDNIPSYIIS